jgi:hypothetical protein
MTYEEAILKIATALVYEKGMTPQETARAVVEAIGLREIMIRAQNWENSFKDHGVVDFEDTMVLASEKIKNNGDRT